MPKASQKASTSARRRPSSRRPAYEDPLTRIHRIRRRMELERRRLGFSHLEFMEYMRQKDEPLQPLVGWP